MRVPNDQNSLPLDLSSSGLPPVPSNIIGSWGSIYKNNIIMFKFIYNRTNIVIIQF